MPLDTHKQARLAALQRQIKQLDIRLEQRQQISNRYTWLRLAIFLIGAAITLIGPFITGASWVFWAGALVTLIVFSVVVGFHRQVKTSILRHKLWRGIKSHHIARMTLDWQHIPAGFAPHPRPDHPFELDLNITGEHSVHQLLDTAVSREGSVRLADWLLATVPDPGAIRRRQALVRELIPLVRFRDRLTLNALFAASDLDGHIETKTLLHWTQSQPSARPLGHILVILAILAAINIGLFLADAAGRLPNLWLISFVIYAAIFLMQWRETNGLFDQAMDIADPLNKLYAVLGYLERYPYGNTPHLRTLCAPFTDQANQPSAHLRRITRVISAASVQQNPILWLLINAIIPWDVYFAYRLGKLRTALAAVLPVWLDTLFDLEALNALATFGYLNPGTTFAEVTPHNVGAGLKPAPTERHAGGEVVFCAEALGHPLIPDAQRVCNDFSLNALGEIVIITGSNMAGKSSFLRTLGVNLCLVYAGGPVVAKALHTDLFRLFTSMQISDSVTEGFSFFYAEVRRLKALLVALEQDHPYPLFFLVDEIFRGTNNRERLIGSRSYVRALAGQHGVGVISTHDLELVKLADDIPQISNYHFREEVFDGRMVFDYKLRPGPCPTTNALKIMQMEGLPVELPPA
ncbi:MAG: hypothetical protein IT324_19400 [Anaerolineae bacterium]|nr:hypothetical protein [Anaerolineae bacterium]